jgi:hypothetical protein
MKRPAGRVKLHPITGETSKTNNKVSELDSNEARSYGFEVSAGDVLVAGGNWQAGVGAPNMVVLLIL